MQETRWRVLEAVAEGPVSGPSIAEALDVSRTAVWKHVEALRSDGFDIQSGDGGYELAATPEFTGAAVELDLDAPYAIEYHETIDSTNRRARELARSGASNVVVLADEQTGGRGRLRREWSSPSGGVWLSVVFRPDVPAAHAPAYTLAAAVAVTRAAREAGVDATIKWPNDVLVAPGGGPEGRPDGDGAIVDDGRKLAGVLTEMEGEADRVSWVIVGIGVNVNVDPDALPDTATSVREQAGDVDRNAFVQRLLEAFDEAGNDLDDTLAEWRENATTLGRRVRVETANGVVEGEAVDVRFPGSLVIDTDEGLVTVSAGDCEHLWPA